MDDLHKAGYDQEDAIYREKDEQWIKAKRAELDARRQQLSAEARKSAHWMKCPKCGADMQEVTMESVKVDRCGECHGVYFDAGELELFSAKPRSGGFLRKLFG